MYKRLRALVKSMGTHSYVVADVSVSARVADLKSFLDTLPTACEIFTSELFTGVVFYSCTTCFPSRIV